MAEEEKVSLNEVKAKFPDLNAELNTTIKLEVEVCVFRNAAGELVVNFNVPTSEDNPNVFEYVFNLEYAGKSGNITWEDIPIALEVDPNAEIWDVNTLG